MTTDELDSETRNPPESVTSFLSQLLRNKDHPNREALTHLIESYTSDLIHGVRRGKSSPQNIFSLVLDCIILLDKDCKSRFYIDLDTA